jgi:hypothetical protein
MIERKQLGLVGAPDAVWSIEFVIDTLAHGRRLKCLTIVADFTRETVDIVVDHGISGLYVARAWERAARSVEESRSARPSSAGFKLIRSTRRLKVASRRQM